MNKLDYIIKQYADAENIKNYDKNSRAFKEEMIDWLTDRKMTEFEYINLLDAMNSKVNDFHIAEVGKTEYDSLVSQDSKTTIITKSTDFFPKDDSRIILPGNFIVTPKGPRLLEEEGKVNYLYDINTFMTHNPYSENMISGWENIYYNGDNLVVGVFGKTYDSDKSEKLEQLFYLKNELKNNFSNNELVDEYTTVRDNYMYVLKSEPNNEKILVKKQ